MVRTHRIQAAALVAVAVAIGGGAATRPAVAGGGCHLPASRGSGQIVEMRELCITPTVIDAELGETVTFVNADPYPHNVTGIGLYGDLRNKGDRFEFTFSEPGIHPFACTLHPSMAGAVVIGDGDDLSAAVAPVALRAEQTSATTNGTGGPGAGWLAAGGLGMVATFGLGRAARRSR